MRPKAIGKEVRSHDQIRRWNRADIVLAHVQFARFIRSMIYASLNQRSCGFYLPSESLDRRGQCALQLARWNPRRPIEDCANRYGIRKTMRAMRNSRILGRARLLVLGLLFLRALVPAGFMLAQVDSGIALVLC